MVTTNQKSVVHAQTNRKESKHNTKASHHHKGREQKKKGTKKDYKSTYISIITLNVNGLNAPITQHRVTEWTQKEDLYICCLKETHFRYKDTH